MKNVLILIALLWAGFSYGQTDSTSGGVFKKPFNVTVKPNSKMPWKNPGTIAIQSLILPGSGYLANDKIVLGFTTMLVEPILAAGGFIIISDMIDLPYGIAFAAFGAAGAIHLVQFAHSVVLANKSNRINGYVMNSSGRKRGATLSLGVRATGVSMNLSF